MIDDRLRALLEQNLPEEELSRALLHLTLEAADPEVAAAVRACALPAWFDADLVQVLCEVDE